MSRDIYKKGDYNIIDDYTGFKRKRSQCQKTWDNNIVAKNIFYVRHPQDFVVGVPDNQSVPESRSEGADVFLTSKVTAEDL